MEKRTHALQEEKTGILRYLWLALGGVSFLLGTAGIVLPLLPTVPFYLLTAFCFAKGSTKFHQWFLNSKFYKNHLAEYERDRSMTWGTKIKVLSITSVLLGLGLYKMQHEPVVQWVMIGSWGIQLFIFLFVIRTRRKTSSNNV